MELYYSKMLCYVRVFATAQNFHCVLINNEGLNIAGIALERFLN